MSTTNTTSEFLFLFRGGDWDRSLSPGELQNTLGGFMAWFDRLSAEGTLKGGQPLMDDARIVSGRNGRNIADGPYAESKEAVGGYFLIRAESLDAAVAVAQQCPILEHGAVVEVRPIAASCPTQQRAQKLAEAGLVPTGV